MLCGALILLLAGCGAVPRIVVPPPAPTYTLFVHVCDASPCEKDNEPHKQPFAEVATTKDGTTYVEHADGAGNLLIRDLVAGTRRICAAAPPRFLDACQDVTVPRAEGQDVFLLLTPNIPPIQPLRTEDRFFTPRLRLNMAGSILMDSDADRDAFLNETVALGFNGIRSFSGALSWAGQTAPIAEQRLPALLAAAASRGLYVYTDALTDSGYDEEAHLTTIARLCGAVVNCLMAAANEVGHPTLGSLGRDAVKLRDVARRVIPPNVVWTVGSSGDEVDANGNYATSGGRFNDGHLDRGRDKWNNVRRLREIYGLAETFRVPAMSGEPIGADEQSSAGRRESDPAFFFAMGVLCRAFDLGCVFHSEDGLHGHSLRPNQKACAEAFLAGWKSIPTDDRLTFLNSGWPGSPVRGANFDGGVVRAYSFVSGSRGWTALVGVTGDPRVEWANGWTPKGVIAQRQGIQVVEIQR